MKYDLEFSLRHDEQSSIIKADELILVGGVRRALGITTLGSDVPKELNELDLAPYRPVN